MLVNGRDCSIIIKTAYREMGVPYSEETLREAVSLLVEEASIEGDGCCRAIKKSGGITGCMVTPLTIGAAPLLLYLAMGSGATEGCDGLPLFVSETRNVYLYQLSLVPMEGGACFDLVQDRGGVRRLFENCRAKGFELRFNRREIVKLKLDVCGEYAPAMYPYAEIATTEIGERFNSDCVTYRINGMEYKNIYGLTLSAKREGGTRTELWIKRSLEQGPKELIANDNFTRPHAVLDNLQTRSPVRVPSWAGPDLPGIIEELTITAQLLKDKYEYRYFGTFRITLKRLVLVSDETAVDCADGVIGPLRYYVAGTVEAEVFTSTGETIA